MAPRVPLPGDASIVPLKRAPMGTPNIPAIWGRRPAPTRFVPFSYFCTCWNETPSRLARSPCDMPAASRCARMDTPTWLSAEVGRLFFVSRLRDCLTAAVCFFIGEHARSIEEHVDTGPYVLP